MRKQSKKGRSKAQWQRLNGGRLTRNMARYELCRPTDPRIYEADRQPPLWLANILQKLRRDPVTVKRAA